MAGAEGLVFSCRFPDHVMIVTNGLVAEGALRLLVLLSVNKSRQRTRRSHLPIDDSRQVSVQPHGKQ